MAYEERYGKVAAVQTVAAKRPHALSMEERKRLTVSGVSEVESFDEHEIVMETSGGRLIIDGEELSISRLSTEQGDVNVEGRISGLNYLESAPRQSLWARLFR